MSFITYSLLFFTSLLYHILISENHPDELNHCTVHNLYMSCLVNFLDMSLIFRNQEKNVICSKLKVFSFI